MKILIFTFATCLHYASSIEGYNMDNLVMFLNDSLMPACSGIRLNETFILTYSECVKSDRPTNLIYNRAQILKTNVKKYRIEIPVENIFIHPEPESIALVKLQWPVPMSRTFLRGRNVFIRWAKIRRVYISRQERVKILSNCRNVTNSENYICASSYGRSERELAKGGPLYIKTASREVRLVGISVPLAWNDYVYTFIRLDRFWNWINGKMDTIRTTHLSSVSTSISPKTSETTTISITPQNTTNFPGPESTIPVKSETTTVSTIPQNTTITSSPETTTIPVSPETTTITPSPETTIIPVSPETTTITPSPETTIIPVSPETTTIFVSPETTTSGNSETTTISTSPQNTTISVIPETTITSNSETVTFSTDPETTASASPATTAITSTDHPGISVTTNTPETTSIPSSASETTIISPDNFEISIIPLFVSKITVLTTKSSVYSNITNIIIFY